MYVIYMHQIQYRETNKQLFIYHVIIYMWISKESAKSGAVLRTVVNPLIINWNVWELSMGHVRWGF